MGSASRPVRARRRSRPDPSDTLPPGPPHKVNLFRARIPSSCSGAESQAQWEEDGCWVHPSHGSTALCLSEPPDPASGQRLEPPPLNAVGSGARGPWPSAQPQAPGSKPPSQRAGWHKCVPTAECPDKHCPWTGGPVSTNKGRCVQPWVCPLVLTPGQGSEPRPLGADTSPQGSFPSPCPTATHIPHREPSQHPACPSCEGWGSQPTAPKGTRLRHHRGKSGGRRWKGCPPLCVLCTTRACIRAE